jgi:hypothetical protein
MYFADKKAVFSRMEIRMAKPWAREESPIGEGNISSPSREKRGLP